jgi:MFS family permease
MAAPAIFTGSLFDKYGHRPLVAVGGILITLGFVFLSLSTEYYQIFLCHTTLIALGCNLL